MQISIVKGGGNCQFHAVVDQNSQKNKYNYLTLKNNVVTFIRSNKNLPYENPSNTSDTLEEKLKNIYFDETFYQFINRMSKDRQWGDNLTLVVMSAILKSPIYSSVENPNEPQIVKCPSHWIGGSANFKKTLNYWSLC